VLAASRLKGEVLQLSKHLSDSVTSSYVTNVEMK